MTTGHRMGPMIHRLRKRPKKTASNARITREPFGDNPIKMLPIPTFIDDYNHYMGGIDQSNQLRAAFTTHFPRNLKEFFPGMFWAIDLAVYNSYKLHLALNGSGTSKSGKRDPEQHRKWVEELMNLLFQVNSDDFGEEITSKPYPKYKYEEVLKGRKKEGKEAFLKAIHESDMDHISGLNPLRKIGWCFFCPSTSVLRPQKEKKSEFDQCTNVFQLNRTDLIEVHKKEGPKTVRNRGKRTTKWCFSCKKFICESCWSSYH